MSAITNSKLKFHPRCSTSAHNYSRASSVDQQLKYIREALRTQLSRLPDIPKSQQLDREMADLRVQRLNYEDSLDRLSKIDTTEQESEHELNTAQVQVYQSLIKTRRELLTSLISGLDAEMLELTKLNVATGQLTDALKEVKCFKPLSFLGRRCSANKHQLSCHVSNGYYSITFSGYLVPTGRCSACYADNTRYIFVSFRFDSISHFQY